MNSYELFTPSMEELSEKYLARHLPKIVELCELLYCKYT